MKSSRGNYTFVVIPDANRSVVRFRLPFFVLPAVGLILAAIAAAAVVFATLSIRNAEKAAALEQQLAATVDDYHRQLTQKNEEISSLQNDVAELSALADSLEKEMAGIRNLETEIREIAGIKVASNLTSTIAGGQGGEEIPLAEGEAGSESDGEVRSLSYAGTNETVSRIANRYQELEQAIAEWTPRLEELREAVLRHQAILRVTPTLWPIDRLDITSPFGKRSDPFTSRPTFHAGIDLGGNIGDPVYATADGKVIVSSRDNTHGNYIVIDHGRGIRTRYLHLNKRLVNVGDKVQKGDVIGELGSTGRSTGPHLHYEVIVNGQNVDPRPYLKTARKDRE
jgi:murein DD-endopeptidase MepM/ murein hydrolase activator NlpD